MLGGFLVVLFCAIALFLIGNNVILNQKRTQLQKQADTLELQLQKLRGDKTELEQGIGEAQSPEYQEKLLREQGLYKKPGEQVITILPPEEENTEQTTEKKRIWWNPRTWF